MRTMKLALLVLLATATMNAKELDKKTMSEIQKVIPSTKIIAAKKSEIDGLYTVFTGAQILYVDAKNKKIFVGSILDDRGVDLTSAELSQALKNFSPKLQKSIYSLTAAEIEDIKRVAIKDDRRGGRYALITFTNPGCPNCVTQDQFLSDKPIDSYYLVVTDPRVAASIFSAQSPLETYKTKNFNIQTQPSDEVIARVEKIRELASSKFFITGTPDSYILDTKLGKIIGRVLGANKIELQKIIDKNIAEGAKK